MPVQQLTVLKSVCLQITGRYFLMFHVFLSLTQLLTCNRDKSFSCVLLYYPFSFTQLDTWFRFDPSFYDPCTLKDLVGVFLNVTESSEWLPVTPSYRMVQENKNREEYSEYRSGSQSSQGYMCYTYSECHWHIWNFEHK